MKIAGPPFCGSIINVAGGYMFSVYAGPAVAIVDERNVSVQEAVFNSGALVRLVCQVRQADRDNFSLHWKVGQAILNHDTQRGGVRYNIIIARLSYSILLRR